MRRILVVEDSPAMRGLIASVIDEHIDDCDVVEAESAYDALKWLPKESFDLVVTDINMPDINGLELISFIRRSPHLCSIPVIIVSSEGQQSDRDRGISLGANAYLTKPFEPDHLASKVRELLGERP